MPNVSPVAFTGTPIEKKDVNAQRQFHRLPSIVYGNHGKFFDADENRERGLILINDDAKKVYEVTEGWAFDNGRFGTREDVVFLINGISVLIIECKNVTKDETIDLGVDQICRYHEKAPESFVPLQIFTATDAIGFSYGVYSAMICLACKGI